MTAGMNRFWTFRRGTTGSMGLLFLVLAIGVGIAHYLPDFNENALAEHIRGKGAYGVLLYIGITAAASALAVPRQGLSFIAGYAFGALYGTLFATIGTTLGCALGFFSARFIGKGFVQRRFAARMRRLDAFIAASPFTMTFTVRCLPFGNNALTNILAGVSSIAPLGFIAGSCLGYIPQNFIFSLLGSGLRVDPFWRVCLAAALFVLAAALGLHLFRRHRALFSDDDKNGTLVRGE